MMKLLTVLMEYRFDGFSLIRITLALIQQQVSLMRQ